MGAVAAAGVRRVVGRGALLDDGHWMQTLGAQWFLVDTPGADTVVALVQVTATLPMMLLAMPAGVLADAFDRRWLLFAVQVYLAVLALLLWVLTATDRMSPWLLLAFTFLLGVGRNTCASTRAASPSATGRSRRPPSASRTRPSPPTTSSHRKREPTTG